QASLNQIIAANSRNVNAGLMRFDTKLHCSAFGWGGICTATVSGNKGGPVVFPVADITAPTDRVALQTTISGLTANGYTPLSETLYEALLYFRGEAPHFGTNPPTDNDIQSVATSLNASGNYASPIAQECQKNHIVYLTDGQPVVDADADTLIGTRLAGANPALTDSACDHNTGDNCLDELGELLATQDHSPGLSGTQKVNVYTVGFLTNQQLLQDTATKGNGAYFTANNALQLSQAFAAILTSIQEDDSTFSAPAVSVNAFNRITNRKELFFSLFSPSTKQRWPGNIKRYELDCQNPDPSNPGYCLDGPDADSDPDLPIILDANGLPAVDSTTGFFKSTSRSVWTPVASGPDGANTEQGGIADAFGGLPGADDPPTRLVYTYSGGYNNVNGTFTPSGNAVLSNTANLLVDSNAAVTEPMFYPAGRNAGEPIRDDLVKWSRGVDVLDADSDGSITDARHQVGDALHSKPVIFEYGANSSSPDLTLYSINNDGYLHAIDVDTGAEVFSFLPQEMLANIPNLYTDQGASGPRPYGLDGPLTLWFDDRPTYSGTTLVAGPNGVLDTGNGEGVYLFFGQRRGGSRYYAVDVTNRANPKLMWKIEGGQGDFAELAQSWSAPVKGRVKIAGVEKEVLFFGGGYDVTQDNATLPQNDTEGRAIFAVDALTGQKLWTAGAAGIMPAPNTTIASMTNSIPADITAFDITGDGLTDRIYFGDTRAQVFRIDIDNDNVGLAGNASGKKKFAIGARVAALQQASATSTPGAAQNRRLFYRPDVSFAAPPDAQPYLAIAIGSGYRAHPLDKVVEDRFYVLRDPQVGNITDPAVYPSSPFTEADLLDITNNLSPSASQLYGTVATPLIGWYLQLADDVAGSLTYQGEKVLAESVTFNNRVLFTTFTPPTTALTPDCLPNQGSGRLFAVNLFDGSPVQDLDNSGSTTLSKSDRTVDLLRSGIPPGVTILFSPVNGVTPIAIVATETMPIGFQLTPVKTYWFQQDTI
ncbi:MAG: hypothetical protein K0U93_16265, partial [Gammaproteobacteria bacterium]|nr:hypothetical protein [Gammaproteobacteria bacterium]